MDVKPVIRTNIDGTFILRDSNLKNRRSLWENYAGIIPDFGMFVILWTKLQTIIRLFIFITPPTVIN